MDENSVVILLSNGLFLTEQMPLDGEKASTASINATLPSSDTTSYSTSSTIFTTTATVTEEDTKQFIVTQDTTTTLFDTTNSTTVTDSSPAQSTTSTLHTASFTVTEMLTSEQTPKTTTPSWTVDDVSSTSTWPETTTIEESDSTSTTYLTSTARTAPTTDGLPTPMSGHGQSTDDFITTAKEMTTTNEDVGPSTDSHSLENGDLRFLLCEVNSGRCTDVVFDIFPGEERLRCRVFPVAVSWTTCVCVCARVLLFLCMMCLNARI